MTGPRAPEQLAYGPLPDQHGHLHPAPHTQPTPVVVLVHGGFWRDQYRADLMEPLARDLTEAGLTAWNIEYRRVGPTGGGWPDTLADVAGAIDHVATLARDHAVDPGRVAVVGHSAGGHLALWAGQRRRLPAAAAGADPAVVPTVVVGLAPVADLVAGCRAGLGDGAVEGFIGGDPDDHPDRFATACPAELLPIDVDQIIVHGRNDDDVPLWLSENYRERAGASAVELLVFDDTDHMDVIDPRHRSWRAVVDRLRARLIG